MSILIVNETTADSVPWTLDGLPSGGGSARLASGTLKAMKSDAARSLAVYNPPASTSYPSFRVGFSPIASGGQAYTYVRDQSEVRLSLHAQIDTANAPYNSCTGGNVAPPSGLVLANVAPAQLSYAVYAQALPPNTGRTPVQSGLVPATGSVIVPGTSMTGYNYFDVELYSVGTGSSPTSTAVVSVQTKTRITFAVLKSSFSMVP